MTGLNYPDHFYADALARDEKPLGAYRSTDPELSESERKLRTALAYVNHARDLIREALGDNEPKAQREAKIAYDVACDHKVPTPVDTTVRADYANARYGDRYGVDWIYHDDRLGYLPAKPERVPKWDPTWGKTPTTVSHGLAWNGPAPPSCAGLSARDIRGPHPMQAEAIRDHDERLSGAEDRL